MGRVAGHHPVGSWRVGSSENTGDLSCDVAPPKLSAADRSVGNKSPGTTIGMTGLSSGTGFTSVPSVAAGEALNEIVPTQ